MFDENDNPRLFTQIVEILQSHLHIFWVDYEQHLIRGILTCRDGLGHFAVLTFDDTRWLRFFIALPAIDCVEPSSLRHLLRIQLANDRLSHVCFDDEHRELDIRSRAYLPTSSIAELVIPPVVQDLQSVLEDEQLIALIRQKRAS